MARLGFGEALTLLEARVIDSNSVALGVDTLQLMECAGRSVAEVVVREVFDGQAEGRRVAVIAGSGGKAGDGFCAARHLTYWGCRVDVYLAAPRIEHPDAAKQLEALQWMDLSISIKRARSVEDFPRDLEGYDVVIDALLGTGVRGRVRGLYADVIELINSFNGPRVSIDLPSGLDPDTGRVLGVAVRATITVTLHKPKRGLLEPSASSYVGKLVVVDIGVPKEAEVYVGPGDVELRVPRRPMKCHKGWAGRVLVVGGSRTFTGAPRLAALAALRGGADLAYILAPRRVADTAASYSPDLITIPVDSDYLEPRHASIAREWIEKSDVVVLGPGLSLEPESLKFARLIIEECRRLSKPMVLDADALKALSQIESLKLWESVVLTPHAGEFRKLFGLDLPEDPLERAEVVASASQRVGCTVLLKGWVDVVCSHEGVCRLNKVHPPSMAVGGTGDVLSGLVAALMARGLNAFDAACLAAYINGLAGCVAYAEKGDHMLASDLLEKIPLAMEKPLEIHKSYAKTYVRVR